MKVRITFEVSEYWRNAIAYHLGLDKRPSHLETSNFIAGLVWGDLEVIADDYDRNTDEKHDQEKNTNH